jgi:hypothetical protein
MSLLKVVGLGIAVASSVSIGALSTGYRIYKQFSLPAQVAGAAGTLQLLVDKRLNSRTLTHYGQYAQDRLDHPESRVPKNGILRYVNVSGEAVSTLKLEKPVVNLERYSESKGDTELFVLTEDWGIEFGSYNGPISNLVVVSGGHISKIETKVGGGTKREKISLMRSLKNGWKKVKGGEFPDILEVSCHPDFDYSGPDARFQVTYSRYHFNGGEWMVKTRTVSGFWEDEGSFPPERLFPKE